MDYSHASNEPVGKPKYQNFQKRNSLISIATILEKSAECDFFYSPVWFDWLSTKNLSGALLLRVRVERRVKHIRWPFFVR